MKKIGYLRLLGAGLSICFLIVGTIDCKGEPPVLPVGWYQPQDHVLLKDLPESIVNNPALKAIQVGSGTITGTWNIERTTDISITQQIAQKQKVQIQKLKEFFAESEIAEKEQYLQELEQALTVISQEGLELQAAYFQDSVQAGGFSPIGPSQMNQTLAQKTSAISDAGPEVTSDYKLRDWHPADGYISLTENAITQSFRFDELTLQKYRTSDYGWEYQADITVPSDYAKKYNGLIGRGLTVFQYGCYDVDRDTITGIPDGWIHNIPNEARAYVDSPFADSIINNPYALPSCFTEQKHVQSIGIGVRFPGKLRAGVSYFSAIPGVWKKGGPAWGDDPSCKGASSKEYVVVSSSATVEAKLPFHPLCSCVTGIARGYAGCMFKAGCDDSEALACLATEPGCLSDGNDETNDAQKLLCYAMEDTAPGNKYGITSVVPWHRNFCALPHGDAWSKYNRPCCDDSECSSSEYCNIPVGEKGGYCQAGSHPPTCTDKAKNGNETAIDCGGNCPKCMDGQTCKINGDCQSGLCSGGMCKPRVVVTCTDGKKNGSETDIDCGGSCNKCIDGKACLLPSDCRSSGCTAGICVPIITAGPCSGGPVPRVSWVAQLPLPIANSNMSSAVLQGKIHTVGGSKEGFRHRVFDPMLNTWTKKADVPSMDVFTDGAAVVLNNVLYAFESGILTGSAYTFRYDEGTDGWTKFAANPFPRRNTVTGILNNKIYMATAVAGNDNKTTVYDPTFDHWTTLASLDPKGSIGSGDAYLGQLYVFNLGLPRDETYAYDPIGNTWSTLAKAPQFRYAGNTILYNGIFWVMGGQDASSLSTDTISLYEPATNKWCTGPKLPETLSFFVAEEVGGKIYLIGGGGAGYESDHVWEGTVY